MKKYEPYKKLTTDEIKYVVAGNEACDVIDNLDVGGQLSLFSIPIQAENQICSVSNTGPKPTGPGTLPTGPSTSAP